MRIYALSLRPLSPRVAGKASGLTRCLGASPWAPRACPPQLVPRSLVPAPGAAGRVLYGGNDQRMRNSAPGTAAEELRMRRCGVPGKKMAAPGRKMAPQTSEEQDVIGCLRYTFRFFSPAPLPARGRECLGADAVPWCPVHPSPSRVCLRMRVPALWLLAPGSSGVSPPRRCRLRSEGGQRALAAPAAAPPRGPWSWRPGGTMTRALPLGAFVRCQGDALVLADSDKATSEVPACSLRSALRLAGTPGAPGRGRPRRCPRLPRRCRRPRRFEPPAAAGPVPLGGSRAGAAPGQRGQGSGAGGGHRRARAPGTSPPGQSPPEPPPAPLAPGSPSPSPAAAPRAPSCPARCPRSVSRSPARGGPGRGSCGSGGHRCCFPSPGPRLPLPAPGMPVCILPGSDTARPVILRSLSSVSSPSSPREIFPRAVSRGQVLTAVFSVPAPGRVPRGR
ncbi:translation initiation factor IF-2-like [Apus apus]|uniref:translation initiation factor IF-2-like n=1 Tax=Apus apus TaxID=8895 RepID=UPI0021F8BEAE|nr:translation initiation factor IF-2-like [Apus apus]